MKLLLLAAVQMQLVAVAATVKLLEPPVESKVALVEVSEKPQPERKRI